MAGQTSGLAIMLACTAKLAAGQLAGMIDAPLASHGRDAAINQYDAYLAYLAQEASRISRLRPGQRVGGGCTCLHRVEAARPVRGFNDPLGRHRADARAGAGYHEYRLTKLVAEGALESDLDDHLGYGKHDPAGRNGGNSRNGHRAKTVLTEADPVEISLPRDRDGSFEPHIAAKRQRQLTGLEGLVISLSAKG